MLQLIRERAQGIIVWVIISLIILAFALVGVNAYLSNDGDAFVAKVNDAEISLSDFQRSYQQERAFRQQLLGADSDSALLDEAMLKRAALDRLVSAEVTAQHVIDAGFRVSDQQLGSRIRHMRDFQSDGHFDPQLYARLLSSQGLSQKKFEASLRRDMLTSQLMSGLMDSEWVSDYEIDALLKLQRQQRRIGYMVLGQHDLTADTSVTDAEVEEYYQTNPRQFAEPEQVSIEYLELSADSLVSDAAVDEDVLRGMYEERAEDFIVGEQRHASHILIKSDDKVSPGQAKDKAQKLLQRIRDGESFEELARQFSEDAGSASQGGDLGYFGTGTMVKPFEDAVFSMQVGDLSEPVKSPYGYHLIKLTDIRPSHGKSFDDVRDELLQQYRDEAAEEKYYELADQLTNLTFEHPDTLSLAAEELGLTVQSSDYFTRDAGQGIAADTQVRKAAFSDDVLVAGNNSDAITLGENHLLVLRIKDHKPVAQRPLDDVRDQIRHRLSADKRRELVARKGDEILQRINDGAQPQAVAKDYHSEWHTTDFIGRDETAVDGQILKAAFALKRPDDKTPQSDGLSLANGDYAIVAVYAVRDGDPKGATPQQREQLRISTSRRLAQQLAARVLDNLKEQADVREFPERIQ